MAGGVRCAFDVMLCLPGVCVQPFPAPSKEELSCLAVPSLCVQAALYPKNLSLGNDLTLQTVFISFVLSFPPLPWSRIATSLMLFVLVFWMTEP